MQPISRFPRIRFTKRSLGDIAFDAFLVVFMLFLIAITLYPLLYAFFASISDPQRLIQHRGLLLRPLGFSLLSYDLVFKNPMIPTGYRNTLFYVVAGTTINLVLTTLGAYGLSRRNVLWQKPLMFLIVFTMFFNGGLIPTFLMVGVTLRMMDTPWALLIPPAISTWNLLIMRTSFQGVPVALEESARIDGANDFHILWRIVIPLSMPVIAVMILFYSVYHWNAFFNAMIYLRTRDLWPLQLVLREILIANLSLDMTAGSASGGDVMPIGETIKYSTIIVATVPILVVYPFLQRYFVKGVMIGAIKE
jgi:putative aldouronate transport system permease protein